MFRNCFQEVTQSVRITSNKAVITNSNSPPTFYANMLKKIKKLEPRMKSRQDEGSLYHVKLGKHVNPTVDKDRTSTSLDAPAAPSIFYFFYLLFIDVSLNIYMERERERNNKASGL
jgi:hypothetical protein